MERAMLRSSSSARRIDTEALKRERPLADLVASYGIALRRESAGTYRALCPFHQERTPSFWIDARDGSNEHYWCFGCLPPGSLIKTSEGMRAIEKIQLGDKVYAGDGHVHEVTRLHEHAFSGELVRIVCAPFKVPILLTPDHKVPLLRPRSRRREEVPAGALRAQNYLLYPAVQRPHERLSWAIRDGWKKTRGFPPHPLPESVDVSALAEWLGWYLAEGSTSSGRIVQFSLGAHELGYDERIRELTQMLFRQQVRYAVSGK